MAYIYILASDKNGTLYIGVTNDLTRRIYEHKNKLTRGFTKKYNVTMLVYFEEYQNITDAIYYEKKLKNLSHKQKIKIIEQNNPHWLDLYETWQH
jgi:putative endonuclease